MCGFGRRRPVAHSGHRFHRRRHKRVVRFIEFYRARPGQQIPEPSETIMLSFKTKTPARVEVTQSAAGPWSGDKTSLIDKVTAFWR